MLGAGRGSGEHSAVTSDEGARQARGASTGDTQRLRDLVNELPQLVWTCSPDGARDYSSRPWLDYTGGAPEGQLGSGWLQHVHPDEREELARAFREAVEAGTELRVEIRLRRHDGQHRWFDTRALPIRKADGTIARWLGSSTDVHDARVAAAALRERDEYLRLVFEHMTEAIIVARLDGQIVYWNPAGLALHGFSNLEPVLRPVLDFQDMYEIATLDGRVLDVSEWPLARVFRGEEVRRMEVRLRRRDIVWERVLSYSGALVTGPEGPLAFVMVSDMTAYRDALVALEESERQVRLAHEAAGIGTFVSDRGAGVVRLSASLARLLGRPGAREMTAVEVQEIVHPGDLAALQPLLDASADANNDGRLRATIRVIRPDGEMRWLALSILTLFGDQGTARIPTYRLGACFDVTELTLAERRLATQNRVSRVLAEAASLSEAMQKLVQVLCESEDWDIGCIWQVDGEARVLRCAEIWQRPAAPLEPLAQMSRSIAFGRDEGLPGKVWARGAPLLVEIGDDPAHPRWALARRAGLRKAMGFPIMLGGAVTGVIDFLGAWGSSADEKLFDMLAAIGQQLGAFFERRRVQREREALEAQLRQSQKMDALGQLSGGIAHDFNNLLTAILGNLHLARESKDTGEIADHLAEIEAASARARQLVRQILTFSRSQPDDRSPVFLGPVVREAAELLRASIPAGVQLVTSLAEEAPAVLADPSQIHQVIVNLGTNAWHAIEGQGGRIAVDVARVAVDARAAIVLGLSRPGVYCRVSVTDTGAGMSAAIQERIFEPFFTTKEAGRGTGLGLSVVYGIVRSHEGSVRVRSAPGEGSTFEVYLPATTEPVVESAPVRSRARSGQGEHVLYIDDEPALVTLMERLMARRGYRLTAFLDPAMGVAAFREDPGQYALVLTDMNMPGMSGIEVAREILAARPEVPVLLASGNVTQDLQERCEALGVRRVVHKPFSIDELGELFRQVLDGEGGAA